MFIPPFACLGVGSSAKRATTPQFGADNPTTRGLEEYKKDVLKMYKEGGNKLRKLNYIKEASEQGYKGKDADKYVDSKMKIAQEKNRLLRENFVTQPAANTPSPSVPRRAEAPPKSITASRGDIAAVKRQQTIIDHFQANRYSSQPLPPNATDEDLQEVGRQLKQQANRYPRKFATVSQEYHAALAQRHTAITTHRPSPDIQAIDPRQLHITSSYRPLATTATTSLPPIPPLPQAYTARGPLRTSNTHGLFPRQLVLQDVAEFPGGPIHTLRLENNAWKEYEEPIQRSSLI
jgi:hypothetical protein